MFNFKIRDYKEQAAGAGNQETSDLLSVAARGEDAEVNANQILEDEAFQNFFARLPAEEQERILSLENNSAEILTAERNHQMAERVKTEAFAFSTNILAEIGLDFASENGDGGATSAEVKMAEYIDNEAANNPELVRRWEELLISRREQMQRIEEKEVFLAKQVEDIFDIDLPDNVEDTFGYLKEQLAKTEEDIALLKRSRGGMLRDVWRRTKSFVGGIFGAENTEADLEQARLRVVEEFGGSKQGEGAEWGMFGAEPDYVKTKLVELKEHLRNLRKATAGLGNVEGLRAEMEEDLRETEKELLLGAIGLKEVVDAAKENFVNTLDDPRTINNPRALSALYSSLAQMEAYMESGGDASSSMSYDAESESMKITSEGVLSKEEVGQFRDKLFARYHEFVLSKGNELVVGQIDRKGLLGGLGKIFDSIKDIPLVERKKLMRTALYEVYCGLIGPENATKRIALLTFVRMQGLPPFESMTSSAGEKVSQGVQSRYTPESSSAMDRGDDDVSGAVVSAGRPHNSPPPGTVSESGNDTLPSALPNRQYKPRIVQHKPRVVLNKKPVHQDTVNNHPERN